MQLKNCVSHFTNGLALASSGVWGARAERLIARWVRLSKKDKRNYF